MKAYFYTILRFLNLLDHEYQLSISNLAMLAMIALAFMVPMQGWEFVLFALVVGVNYAHKRDLIQKFRMHEDREVELNMVMIQNQIDQVKDEINSQVRVNDGVGKALEEIKGILNKASLASAFKPRNQRQ